MIDILIGIIATIASTVILGLFGMFIITPYRNHQEILKKILRIIRNYEDPRKYQGQMLPTSLMVDCIEKQICQIEEVFDLMDEQKDLNPVLYKLFGYEKTEGLLHILFEYIRNPIMLKDSKEFDDEYLLDTDKIFSNIKKKARFPWIKFGIIALILLLLFISILVTLFKLAIVSKCTKYKNTSLNTAQTRLRAVFL